MADRSDSGVSLKDDIASILTDSTFHDVTIVCADGVEIGACRAILASRSVVFKAMLYGYMKESTSDKISFHDIKSTAMHAVLRYIHTEDIDSNVIPIAIEVYHAANFLLLPKLTELVFDQAHKLANFSIATSLVNDAAASVPLNDNTESLFDAVFKPFCATSLAIGDLNEFSDKAMDVFLTHTTTTVDFQTSEYDLLLCVIEWAWARDTDALPADERRAIFDDINSLPTKPSIKIRLQSEPSRQSLLEMLKQFDLELVCPHRLKCLIRSINVFDELPPVAWTFCYHACENTKCDPTHSSKFRGDLSYPKLQWDQSRQVSGLVFSEEDTVVEYPESPVRSKQEIVRTSAKCLVNDDDIAEWTIVIESLGSGSRADVGFLDETWNKSLPYLHEAGWCFFSHKRDSRTYCKGKLTSRSYGVELQTGDTVTFHLNLKTHTCALSINGRDYGLAWKNLPRKANLYPAVGLFHQSKYRINVKTDFSVKT